LSQETKMGVRIRNKSRNKISKQRITMADKTDSRDCNCNPGIPKSRDYERPNPGISVLENNVLTLLLRVKCMH